MVARMLFQAIVSLAVICIAVMFIALIAAVLFAQHRFVHHESYTLLLLLLTTTAILWRGARPTPRPLLRWYIAVAAAISVLAMIPTCLVDQLSEHYAGFGVSMDASLIITACLVLEIALSTKAGSELARAIARIRRSRSAIGSYRRT